MRLQSSDIDGTLVPVEISRETRLDVHHYYAKVTQFITRIPQPL